MKFKQWLLNEDEALSWDNDAKKWYYRSIGHHSPLDVYITKNKVMFDVSPKHPMLKKAIKTLIRQRPSSIEKAIVFDGWSPGTVNKYINDPQFHGPKDKLPQFLYTGTSLHHWERIREEGLKPRNETGESPVYGANSFSALPANEDYIYLAGNPTDATKFAAREAGGNTRSQPVILKIDARGLNYERLRPDEDSGQSDWDKSYHKLNTLAYAGSIAPQFIELYKVAGEQGFVDPDPKLSDPDYWFQKKDWLAQQMLNRQGYQKVPGSDNSVFKWAK